MSQGARVMGNQLGAHDNEGCNIVIVLYVFVQWTLSFEVACSLRSLVCFFWDEFCLISKREVTPTLKIVKR